jgi:F-type H+-transporting ATPase subunit b
LGIDWKLLIGQLINFAIILAVLWKWVFGPVSKKLTERANKIEKSLIDADRIAKEKLEFEKWHAEQMVNARHEATTIVAQAQKDATQVKDATLAKTREEQEKLVEQAKKQIQDEKAEALRAAKGELADLVTNATEKIIRQKLDAKKDEGFIKDILKSI